MKAKVKVRAKYVSKCTVHYVSNNVSVVCRCASYLSQLSDPDGAEILVSSKNGFNNSSTFNVTLCEVIGLTSFFVLPLV